jgi:predicted TIM-barrel fold metal-dependent hydrolase
MIIDVHTHHYLGVETQRNTHPVEPFMALAKQAGVTRVNLLGNLCRNGEILRPPARDVRGINTLTMQQVSRYPDFLSGFCYLNPILDRRFLLDEIERCVADGNLIGLKFEIDLNCRDPRLDPLLNRAQQLDVPILHHAWYTRDRHIHHPHASFPHDVADLAIRHPGVTIIMAHLSGTGVRGILDVLPCKNVCIDTSGGQPLAGLVEYAVEKLGADRLLYGSDVVVRDFASQVARVKAARISRADKEKVLWKNAARILKLTD